MAQAAAWSTSRRELTVSAINLASLAGAGVNLREADVQALPFPDASCETTILSKAWSCPFSGGPAAIQVSFSPAVHYGVWAEAQA